MPYPEEWVAPARQELIQMGARELRTVEEVDQLFTSADGTALIVINSICGCAAGSARPAIAAALEAGPKPDHLMTVFAGQDLEATERVRDYFSPQPPSSPSVALIKNGKLVYMMHRHQIEGRAPEAIAADLQEALQEYCG